MKIESISSSIFKIGGVAYAKGDYSPIYTNLAFLDGEANEAKSAPKVNLINKNTGIPVFSNDIAWYVFTDNVGDLYSDFATFSLAFAEVISGGTISVGPTGPVGPQGATGAQGLNWQGVWDTNSEYVLNDAVGYDGASYFNILGISTSNNDNPSVDTTHWALLASQGAVGPAGATGATGPAGANGAVGATGPQGLPGGLTTKTTENLTSSTNSAPFPYSNTDFAKFTSSSVSYALPIATLGDVKYIISQFATTLYASPNPGNDGANNNFITPDGNGNSMMTLLSNKSYRFTYIGRYSGSYGYWVAEVMNN